MMTHDEMIAVITHHKNGGNVEYKDHGAETWIKLLTEPLWNFARHDYRIKPEPRSLWVVRDEQGRDKEIFWKLNNAETCVRVNTSWTITEYKEVTE